MKTPFTADMLCYQFHLKIDDCNQIKIQKRDKTEDDEWTHRRDEVMSARQFATDNHICVKCLKKLTAIGQDRKNGKSHKDWSSRELHKKCFKEIIN